MLSRCSGWTSWPGREKDLRSFPFVMKNKSLCLVSLQAASPLPAAFMLFWPDCALNQKMDIRKQQKQAILKMLALNEDDETSAEAPIDWKVLILDEPCRELLAPLVSVNELRARGVTLHAPIESPRDALGDVAAVYLCRPSAANAARIAKDAAQALYGALHCNWSRRAERKVLEGFARELAAAPPREGLPAAEDLVRSVWDRHVDFVALEPRLFHLRLQRRLKEVCGAAALRGG